MTESAFAPDPDLVYGLYTGAFKTQFVRMALLLDVFAQLADGPADAATVASACDCDVSGTRALLNYFSSVELLNREGDTYSLTPTAATFLVPGEASYAGQWLLAQTSPEFWSDMLGAVQTGHPCHHPFPWAQDAWLESHRSSRIPLSLDMWRAAGIKPGMGRELRIADLGSGCGIKSFALAQADADLLITCVDSIEVLDVARDLAARLHIMPQVTFRSGDLLTMDLGFDYYDAALLAQVTYALTADQNLDLFRRVGRALKVGGVLVVDSIMSTERPGELASLATLLMWGLTGGAAYSFADYRTWLEASGFRQVTKRSELWLTAVKR